MKRYLYKSIGLHITAFLLLVLDLPFFSSPKMTMGQAPIIVDLKDIKLAEMTNLPPKAVLGDEDKKATAPKEEKKPEQKEKLKRIINKICKLTVIYSLTLFVFTITLSISFLFLWVTIPLTIIFLAAIITYEFTKSSK